MKELTITVDILTLYLHSTCASQNQNARMNLTVSVPEGSSNHGDPNLICTPPKWYDYILFFFTNYLAHAATIVSVPGQSVTETICVGVAALLAPSSGIMRAMEVFIRRPVFRSRNPMEQAAAAMALCMVVKTNWVADEYGGAIEINTTEHPWMINRVTLVRHLANIHGHFHLPEGYWFGYVPASLRLVPREKERKHPWAKRPRSEWGSTGEPQAQIRHKLLLGDAAVHTLEGVGERRPTRPPQKQPQRLHRALAASYNIPKAFVSLAQAIWAIITLYRSRGNQIDEYGYAAFGLTVASYAYMSIINLIATCLTPEYPAIYMVRTSIMDEAEENGAVIVGEVADIHLDPNQEVKYDADHTTDFAWICGFLFSLPPLAIVGGLSRFATGNSSLLERGFTMAWLATGLFAGLWVYLILGYIYVLHPSLTRLGMEARAHSIASLLFFTLTVVVPLAAPAVGGFVVVAKMLSEYGMCVDLS